MPLGQVEHGTRLHDATRPFADTHLRDDRIRTILSQSILRDIEPRDLPDDLPLDDVIANNCRVRAIKPRGVIDLEGSFGRRVFCLPGSKGNGPVPRVAVVTLLGSRRVEPHS